MPVRAKVGEAGGGVRQQVPGDDGDGVADRDQGPLFTAAAGQPMIAGAEESFGPAAPRPASPRVPEIHGLPWPVLAGLFFPADWRARGAYLAQDTR